MGNFEDPTSIISGLSHRYKKTDRHQVFRIMATLMRNMRVRWAIEVHEAEGPCSP